ncbi:MAG: ABC transporter ATP-binding protein, partial [Robiginitomaculum sp.]|nr:ABC transporter ATP-binding protein [Robiginitomaculum sp.]
MLKIENIHKRFGNVHALNNVSLDLKPGLFGLLGPNGAGKSTLMRTLATLQLPDEGRVTYNDVDIAKTPDVMRKVLGYLPQDFGVYPRMSAEALLDHIAVLKGVSNKSERKAQISELLKAVNLYKMRTASVSTYSGGMRQRFGVAQAMLGDPQVLIVDEPTAGLDPFERQRFLDLLSEAGEEKIIILSTHIVEDVRDLCPDMAIMGEGKIVARGAPEDLIGKIRNKVWRKKVDKTDVDTLKENHKVLSTRLLMGGVIVSVLS